MDDATREETDQHFGEVVNTAPKDLKEWLETEGSKCVGDRDSGESTGHRSVRKIGGIKPKGELTDADYEHVNQVVGYVHRHQAQRPEGAVAGTPA